MVCNVNTTITKIIITRLVLQVVFSDNCCMDRSALQETLGPASVTDPDKSSVAPASVQQAPSLPILKFPDSMKPYVIVVSSEGCQTSALACDQLLRYATESARHIPGNRPVLGFDCEWVPSLHGRGKVALIQMSCLDGFTVIFRLKVRGGSDEGIFPKALKELMENEEVDLVRICVFACTSASLKLYNCSAQRFLATAASL